MELGKWFWGTFKYLGNPLPITNSEREERIVDEAFDAGFEAGREQEREEIIKDLTKK